MSGSEHTCVRRAWAHPAQPSIHLLTCIQCGAPDWQDLDRLLNGTVQAANRVTLRRMREIFHLPEPGPAGDRQPG